MTPDGLPQPFPASVLAQYPWLDDLITQQIKQRLRSTPSGVEAPTGCLLVDLGECLLQMHSAMSDLMHEIVWDRNVESYLEDEIKRAKQARGQEHSDTEFIDYLTQQEQSVKYDMSYSLGLMARLTSYAGCSRATSHSRLKY